MDLRKCWRCKIEKELTTDNFAKDCTDGKGFQKACKECQKNHTKTYREKHPEYFKQKGKEKYKKEDNLKRYKKYRDSYLKRREVAGQTVRGRIYTLFDAARTRAKKNNLLFTIDLDFVLKLYEAQEGKCKLTGINFTFEKRGETRFFNPFNPSIDKINSAGSYTPDNIRLVCTIVNLALNTFGEDNFRIMCQAYLNHSTNVNI